MPNVAAPWVTHTATSRPQSQSPGCVEELTRAVSERERERVGTRDPQPDGLWGQVQRERGSGTLRETKPDKLNIPASAPPALTDITAGAGARVCPAPHPTPEELSLQRRLGPSHTLTEKDGREAGREGEPNSGPASATDPTFRMGLSTPCWPLLGDSLSAPSLAPCGSQ